MLEGHVSFMHDSVAHPAINFVAEQKWCERGMHDKLDDARADSPSVLVQLLMVHCRLAVCSKPVMRTCRLPVRFVVLLKRIWRSLGMQDTMRALVQAALACLVKMQMLALALIVIRGQCQAAVASKRQVDMDAWHKWSR